MFDLVSVVVPTHNRASLLTEQLAALTRQTYKGQWELIVVVNGSTDDTPELLDSYANSLPLQSIFAEVLGASHARNIGARAARGNLLLFIDDDDRVTPAWLQGMVNASNNWDIVRGNNHNFRHDRHGTSRAIYSEYEGLIPFFGFLPSISASNCAIRRELFERLGGFDERYPRYEDTQLSWRAQLMGSKAGYAHDAVVDYRLRTGMRAVFSQKYQDERIVPQLYLEFRASGMPRSTVSLTVQMWRRVVKLLMLHPFSPRAREGLASATGQQLGRIVGSFRCRTIYL